MSQWLYCKEERDDASLRLFCFPYGGGSAREYDSWSADLPDSIEVVAIELPGHGTRRAEPALESMAVLLDQLEAELRDNVQSWLDKPFAFFGHSAGAIIAFALALRIQQRGGAMPRRLFLSASAAPLSGAHSDGLPDGWRTDDAAFVAAVREWGGVPSDEELMADPSAIALLFSALRCDMAVMTSFESLSEEDWNARVAHGKLGCAVSLLAGADDQVVPASAMARWLELDAGSEGEAPEVRVIEGDHFFWKEGRDGRAQTIACVTALLEEDIRTASADAVASIQRWNSGSEAWPSQKLLHELFVDSAGKTPDAVAVFDGTTGLSMTYAELDSKSDLLARYLFHHGVMVESITGILMEHCVEYVIAYIAALKVGGAYMPLETAYPADLLSKVLTATPIAVVLTKKAFADRLPAHQKYFLMDADWLGDAQRHLKQPLDPLAKRVVPDRTFEDREKPTPHSSAFVVMSSGTTGTPKGIVQVHRAAVHSYAWRLRHYPFVPGDRVACHVFFVWELLRPLLNGTGTPMYVIPDEVIYDPGPLLTFLEQHAITRILFTPSLCQLLLDSFSADELSRRLGSTLTLVWLCGEVVTVELRNRFCTALPNCRLVSLYSISECHDVSAVDLHEPTSLVNSPKYAPCGRVMANVTVKILGGQDGASGQVPIGVPGEVYVGGPVLARGYHGQVKKTAERFVPDPEGDGTFDRHTGEGLLYRTGDRGRFLPDGQLEIIGRCDFMVKVRGYSIVLGAVEVALSEFPGIATAVVVTEGAEGTDKRLVAYVVPELKARTPSSSTLRQFLSQKLPHYAIPSVFCVLDAMPVHAASGKTDRKSLPRSDEERVQRLRAYSIEGEHAEQGDTPLPPPQNAKLDQTEVALRKIWCDLIGIDATEAQAIGRDTSFFDVGGHSLLAPRLVAACNKAFEGSALTLSAVLLTPALGDIAAAVCGGVKHANSDTAGSKQVALADEVVLDPSISFVKSRFAPARCCSPRRVLLTGSTGYVGAYILRQLLKMAADVGIMIYCLVRITNENVAGKSRKLLDSLQKEHCHTATELPSSEQLGRLAEHEAGLDRLREVLRSFDLWRDASHSDDEEKTEFVTEDMLRTHVQIIRGDLQKPLLGLTQDAFRMLGGECDAIIHSGAEVNLVKSYAALKAANVNGTHEVLRLATTNGLALHAGAKPVYFISTNGVFPASVSEQLEDADVATFGPQLEGGYAQSKWVAEQLVLKARQSGLPAAVFRLGNMAPSSTQPRWNPHDFYFLLLKACKILGATPAFGDGDQTEGTKNNGPGITCDWWFDFTPVDFAAAAICQLAVQAPTHGIDKVLHVQNKQRAVSASTLFDWAREQDASIRSVDLASWKMMLQTAVDNHGGKFAATDLNVLRQLSAGLPSFEYYFESPAHFHSAALLEALEASFCAGTHNTCVSCPEIDAKLTQKYFAAL